MITFKEKYNANMILVKSFEFAKKVVLYAEELEKLRKFVVANQILKSGTSIGANVKEAQMLKAKPTSFIK